MKEVVRVADEQLSRFISAIKLSVAPSLFSSLRLYYDARTNIHQTILSLKVKNPI